MSDRESLASAIESIEGGNAVEVETLKSAVECLRAGVRNALSVGRTWNGSQVEFEEFLLVNLKPEDQYALAKLYIEEGGYHSVMHLLKSGDVSIKKQVLLDFITTASYPFKYFYSGGKIYEEAIRSLLDKDVALALARFADYTDFFSECVHLFRGLDKEVGLKWAAEGGEVCVAENIDRFPGLTLLDIAQVLSEKGRKEHDEPTEGLTKLDNHAAIRLIDNGEGEFVCRNFHSFEGLNQKEIADKLMTKRPLFISLLNSLANFDEIDHAHVVERFFTMEDDVNHEFRGQLVCIRIKQIDVSGRKRLKELLLANGEEELVMWYFREFGIDEDEAMSRLVRFARENGDGMPPTDILTLIELGKFSRINRDVIALLRERGCHDVLRDNRDRLDLNDEEIRGLFS